MKLLNLLRLRINRTLKSPYFYAPPAIHKTAKIVTYYKARPNGVNTSSRRSRLNPRNIISHLVRHATKPWSDTEWNKRESSF